MLMDGAREQAVRTKLSRETRPARVCVFLMVFVHPVFAVGWPADGCAIDFP